MGSNLVAVPDFGAPAETEREADKALIDARWARFEATMHAMRTAGGATDAPPAAAGPVQPATPAERSRPRLARVLVPLASLLVGVAIGSAAVLVLPPLIVSTPAGPAVVVSAAAPLPARHRTADITALPSVDFAGAAPVERGRRPVMPPPAAVASPRPIVDTEVAAAAGPRVRAPVPAPRSAAVAGSAGRGLFTRTPVVVRFAGGDAALAEEVRRALLRAGVTSVTVERADGPRGDALVRYARPVERDAAIEVLRRLVPLMVSRGAAPLHGVRLADGGDGIEVFVAMP